MTFPKNTIVRHKKTDELYRVVFTPIECRIESTGEPAYAYEGNIGGVEYGGVKWIRSQAEMEDGRFEHTGQMVEDVF